jgi:hypothetical protein
MRFIDEQSKNSDMTKEYEMPYYHWEAGMLNVGNEEVNDNAQGYHFEGFKGFGNLARATNENRLVHFQIKK